MENFEFDFDVSLFNDVSINGVFLTKIDYFPGEKIEATYHEFKQGQVQKTYLEEYDDLSSERKELNKLKYATVMKLIEINDKELFQRLDIDLDKMLEYHKEYVFKNMLSFSGILGSIGLGYSIANLQSNDNEIKAALVASLGLVIVGIYLRKEYLKIKKVYDKDTDSFRNDVLNMSDKYCRIKKKVE